MAFQFSLTPNSDGSLDGNFPNGDKPATAPGLLTLSDVVYAGAFRYNGNQFGGQDLTFSDKSTIAYNASTGNMLITSSGLSNTKYFGEFDIPALSTSLTLTDLNIAANTQPFVNVLDNIPVNPADDDDGSGTTIYGMFERNGKILTNFARYYDNFPFNDYIACVKPDSTDISNPADVAGGFLYTSGQKAAIWASEIPAAWQGRLGGTHICGSSSGTSRGILARYSVGPSAHVFDPDDLLDPVPVAGTTITTTPILDYSYPNALGVTNPANIDNEVFQAGFTWNLATETNYGFIVPGTDTYAVFGHQAGFNSGLGYKLRNPGESPTDLGDFDAVDPLDYRNIYMFFDANDLERVKNGEIQPYEVVPYEWGTFDVPFGGTPASGINTISGGTFDPVSGRLYLNLIYADTSQGFASALPLTVAFTFNT